MRLHNKVSNKVSKMAAIRHVGFVMRMIGTTCEEYLMVFIVMQNLVGISHVVLTICEL